MRRLGDAAVVTGGCLRNALRFRYSQTHPHSYQHVVHKANQTPQGDDWSIAWKTTDGEE